MNFVFLSRSQDAFNFFFKKNSIILKVKPFNLTELTIIFSYADILIKITPDSIRATKNNVEVQLDSTKRLFKVENLVLEMGESIQLTNLADLVRFRVDQKDGFLELKTFGLSDDEFSNGLLVQLNKLEPNLLEGSQIKNHRTSTLLINGKIKLMI